MLLIILTLCANLITASPDDPVKLEIKEIRQDILALSSEVQLAKRIVGLAETMEYVEKIGRIQQLKDQMAELQSSTQESTSG